MVTVQLLLGTSLQTTRDLAPRPRQMTRSLASSPPTHLISEPAWTPLLLLNHSPFAPLLMGTRAFSVTSPRGDYRMGRVGVCRLWLAQISTKVCFFQVQDDGTLTLAQGQCSFRRTFEPKILQVG